MGVKVCKLGPKAKKPKDALDSAHCITDIQRNSYNKVDSVFLIGRSKIERQASMVKWSNITIGKE